MCKNRLPVRLSLSVDYSDSTSQSIESIKLKKVENKTLFGTLTQLPCNIENRKKSWRERRDCKLAAMCLSRIGDCSPLIGHLDWRTELRTTKHCSPWQVLFLPLQTIRFFSMYQSTIWLSLLFAQWDSLFASPRLFICFLDWLLQINYLLWRLFIFLFEY